eukprot:9110576-Ditylum_brightwellii.AAC.1
MPGKKGDAVKNQTELKDDQTKFSLSFMDWHRKKCCSMHFSENARELSTKEINASMLAAKGFSSAFICSSITAKLRTTSNNIFGGGILPSIDATAYCH